MKPLKEALISKNNRNWASINYFDKNTLKFGQVLMTREKNYCTFIPKKEAKIVISELSSTGSLINSDILLEQSKVGFGWAWTDLDGYDNNLKSEYAKELDIVRIYHNNIFKDSNYEFNEDFVENYNELISSWVKGRKFIKR